MSTDLLSATSSLGQLSTESLDLESNLSAEVNGVLQDSSDPEAFSVLELPEPSPDLLSKDVHRTGTPRWDQAGETEPHREVLSSPLQPREGAEGGDATEPKEEPCPADGGPNSRQSPCQGQDSSVEAQEVGGLEPEAPLLDLPPVPSGLSWAPGAEGWLPETRADQGGTEETGPQQGLLMHMEAPGRLGSKAWPAGVGSDPGQRAGAASECAWGSGGGRGTPPVSALAAGTREPRPEHPSQDQALTSSDEEDIYGRGPPSSSSETSVAELGGSRSPQGLGRLAPQDAGLLKADQVRGLFSGKVTGRLVVFLLEDRNSVSTAKPAG